MNFLDQIKNASLNVNSPILISELLINFFVGIIISIIIQKHYVRFSSTLTNREQFSKIFPIVLLTTLLIISIVKSSLALSLGLVGALSIVRFRTPIKEPEELSYLFVCIASGLGLGANQTLPTIVGVTVILTFLLLLKKSSAKQKSKNMFITIEQNNINKDDEKKILANLNTLMAENLDGFDLRRIDYSGNNLNATYLVSINNIKSLEHLFNAIKDKYPNSALNYIDQNHIPSI
jgi:hypothetical protein